MQMLYFLVKLQTPPQTPKQYYKCLKHFTCDMHQKTEVVYKFPSNFPGSFNNVV